MSNALKQIIYMKATLWLNAFCYYFKHLWLIGNFLPDSIYSRYGQKKTLAIVVVIFRQLIDFFGKPIYLLSFVGLPLLLLQKSRPEPAEQGFALMVQILFFLNCIIGSFGDSQIFTVTRDKITCIKYLHMDARAYLQGYLTFKYLPFFLYFLPWLLIAARLLDGTLAQGFVLWLLLFSFRMIGEALHLLIFDRTGKVISRNTLYSFAIIGVGLTGAYLPLAFNWSPSLAAILLHPVCIVVYLALGIVSFWYITVGYRGYEEKFHRSIDLNFLLSTILKSSGSATFKEVEIKETDKEVSEAEQVKLKNLKGYSYLNALFFARHKRQLVRPLYYRLVIIAGIFAASIVFFIINQPLAVQLSENITASLLPGSVFIMYCMTVADKACRSMFYNCDKDMLHFSYYRKPEVILQNFKIRFLRVVQYNAVIAGVLCLAVIVFCLICGTNIFSWDIFLFCITVFLLSVLFSAHHLCLYYIFQPYSENLQVKNPFYPIINTIMYMLCMLCLQIDVGGPVFTIIVLAFTAVYIAAALAAVYFLAPKSFRIK